MEASDHDERLRRLQRLAYGADTPPEERAAAEAELQAMSDAAASAATAAAESGVGVVSDDTGSPAPARDLDAPARDRGASSTAMRWAVGAGVAALVVGIAVGVGVSGLTSAQAGPGSIGTTDAIDAGTEAGAGSDPSVITGPGTPIELTPIYEVFEREQRPADAVADDVLLGTDLDRASTRLLLTRSDGVDLFAATQGGGEELCIVVVAADLAGSGSACTDGGIVPPAGMTVSFGFVDQGPPITASLHADGTAGLNAAEEPAAE
ncbi:hypothetical protein ACFVAJ_06385 [Agromyces sp. NPDC057679]|uniref:hypothetical protein n=1 Tax=Agromyces sp. NPDC057679 TaxID=3346207 RepID=UPI00366F31F6